MNCKQVRCLLLAGVAMWTNGAVQAQPRNASPQAPRNEPATPQHASVDPCDGHPCFASARARAVADAWSNGFDANGIPLDETARREKLAEVESWLPRLVGTFRIEGTYTNRGGRSEIQGTSRCLGLGDGPGVTCLINASWKAPREAIKSPAFDSALSNAMQSLVLVLGMDPDSAQVRASLMDQRATKTHGVLVDGEVTFIGEHKTGAPLVDYTWESAFVAVHPDGGVAMKFAVRPTEARYTLEGLRLEYLQSARDSSPKTWVEFDMRLLREPPLAAGSP